MTDAEVDTAIARMERTLVEMLVEWRAMARKVAELKRLRARRIVGGAPN